MAPDDANGLLRSASQTQLSVPGSPVSEQEAFHNLFAAFGQDDTHSVKHKASYDKLLNLVGSGIAMVSGSPFTSKAEFQVDVNKLRVRFDSMYKYVLDPRSVLVERWDLLITIALLYTCFVTPCALPLPSHNPPEVRVYRIFVLTSLSGPTQIRFHHHSNPTSTPTNLHSTHPPKTTNNERAAACACTSPAGRSDGHARTHARVLTLARSLARSHARTHARTHTSVPTQARTTRCATSNCDWRCVRYEIGMDLPTRVDGLFVINQVSNVIFLVDMGMQFFLPFSDAKVGGPSAVIGCDRKVCGKQSAANQRRISCQSAVFGGQQSVSGGRWPVDAVVQQSLGGGQ